MKLVTLQESIDDHFGDFVCSQIHNEASKKTVQFKHIHKPPEPYTRNIPVEKLKDFYDTFSNLLMYYDEESGDAGVHIASPSQWDSLEIEFRDWLDIVDEDERDEVFPDWIDACLVIGEVPHSGNYYLMPITGENKGYVFEFEHDGFEFIELANDIEQFILKMLNPDSEQLTNMASHMRFIEKNSEKQWWIEELKDNNGNVITTEQ